MQAVNTDQMTFTDARHMPIVKEYARQIGLAETIDQIVDTQMELSPGMAVLAMVLDTLSGRTPLYRLTEFFEEMEEMRKQSAILGGEESGHTVFLEHQTTGDGMLTALKLLEVISMEKNHYPS
jgi:phosphomannomutase